jgi:hypothetical protein
VSDLNSVWIVVAHVGCFVVFWILEGGARRGAFRSDTEIGSVQFRKTVFSVQTIQTAITAIRSDTEIGSQCSQHSPCKVSVSALCCVLGDLRSVAFCYFLGGLRSENTAFCGN